ncbi:hypothetical protein AB0I84_24665 [Streptomyces spectabilis]|uniref:hypothetical protein n=1 Tax=Streptomyces spectabilis TaxID=68270 RepID=UPI00340E66E5
MAQSLCMVGWCAAGGQHTDPGPVLQAAASVEHRQAFRSDIEDLTWVMEWSRAGSA